MTDTCSWPQSVSRPNPTRANCSQMSSDIRQLTPSESNSENARFYCLARRLPKPVLSVHEPAGASAIFDRHILFTPFIGTQRQRRRRGGRRPSLTSEVEVAQVVCDHLLGGFLRAQFDSAGEKDVPLPSGDDCAALLRRLGVRHASDPWKRRGRRAVREAEVAHGGALQCSICGAKKINSHLLRSPPTSSKGCFWGWRTRTSGGVWTRHLPDSMSTDWSIRQETTEQRAKPHHARPMVAPRPSFSSADSGKDPAEGHFLSRRGTTTRTPSCKLA